MKEKIIIIFIALVIGLTITTIAFYIYQTTKNIPQQVSNQIAKNTSNQEKNNERNEFNNILTITEPKNENITNKRTIEVKGKTNSTHTVIVSSNTEDVVTAPNSNGEFLATLSIDAGSNRIIVRSVAPNGEEATQEKIITFTQEEF